MKGWLLVCLVCIGVVGVCVHGTSESLAMGSVAVGEGDLQVGQLVFDPSGNYTVMLRAGTYYASVDYKMLSARVVIYGPQGEVLNSLGNLTVRFTTSEVGVYTISVDQGSVLLLLEWLEMDRDYSFVLNESYPQYGYIAATGADSEISFQVDLDVPLDGDLDLYAYRYLENISSQTHSQLSSNPKGEGESVIVSANVGVFIIRWMSGSGQYTMSYRCIGNLQAIHFALMILSTLGVLFVGSVLFLVYRGIRISTKLKT